MRNCFSLIILSVLAFGGSAVAQESRYDSVLAKKLGADEIGMKHYVLVILKTGPAQITDSVKRSELFKGHMNNIKRLVKEGKMIVAGPFGKNTLTYRGLFIMNVPTIEEAKPLVETDPTVQSKIFEVEYLPWYGSAALSEYLPFHDLIQKKK